MLNTSTIYQLDRAIAVFSFCLIALGPMVSLGGCTVEAPGPKRTAASLANEAAEVALEGCQPLMRRPGFNEAWANGTGKRCLIEDLVQVKAYDFIEGRGYEHSSPQRRGVIAVQGALNLEVDLREHLVTGWPHDNTTGIVVHSDSTYISIRNGPVRTPGRLGIGVSMASTKTPPYQDFSEDDKPPTNLGLSDSSASSKVVEIPWNYQPATHYTLDTLKIQAGGRGVILAGAYNVLRNSTIEVDSATAAYIYGPNAIVEGNTFIVHQAVGQPEPTSAILKLRDADGAVIRNNRFIIKGLFSGKAQAAINLLKSKNVIVEGNIAIDVQQLVRKDAASTTVERSNALK